MTMPIVLLGLTIITVLYIYIAKPYPIIFIKIEKRNSIFRNLKNGRDLKIENVLILKDKESVKNQEEAKINFSIIRQYPKFIGENGEIFKNGESFSFFIMRNMPKIISNPLFLIRPVVILNLSFLNREITDYEQRAIKDLIKYAGAFKCYLWTGEELFPHHVGSTIPQGKYIGQSFKRIKAK
ncbi:MAG: hypothetical protein HQK83_14560 [Fibrobacteria bacterium]|nr:hypothetical protein [Fibrobacteria bacterium]